MATRYCSICEAKVVKKSIHDMPVCEACYDVLQCVAICATCGGIVNIKTCIKKDGQYHHHACYCDTKETRLF